jgi:hypothetical protein
MIPQSKAADLNSLVVRRLCMVELLVKIACLVKKYIMSEVSKAADLN